MNVHQCPLFSKCCTQVNWCALIRALRLFKTNTITQVGLRFRYIVIITPRIYSYCFTSRFFHLYYQQLSDHVGIKTWYNGGILGGTKQQLKYIMDIISAPTHSRLFQLKTWLGADRKMPSSSSTPGSEVRFYSRLISPLSHHNVDNIPIFLNRKMGNRTTFFLWHVTYALLIVQIRCLLSLMVMLGGRQERCNLGGFWVRVQGPAWRLCTCCLI